LVRILKPLDALVYHSRRNYLFFSSPYTSYT
jgi:hypothetical protein